MATSDSLSISGPKLRIQTENLDKGSYLTTQQHSGRPTNIPTIPSVSPGTVEGTSATVQPQRPLRATARSAPDEIQKLLGQLLYQLEERPKPPPTSDSLKENVTRVTDGRLVAAVGTVVGAIRLQRSILEGQTRNLEADDDADLDDQNQGFTTDTTFSILNQLKDVLSVSFAQGWNLFSAGTSHDLRQQKSVGKAPSSPFRLRRNSFQNKGYSRSPSPVNQDAETSAMAGILRRCIILLSSIIREDCRYQTSSPRPSRPPNALQAVTLEFSQFLFFVHRDDPSIQSQVVFALLPAFQTFRPEMHHRLLSFFNEVVLGSTLQTLSEARGGLRLLNESATSPDHRARMSTSVSIKIEIAEGDESSFQADQAWVPWSSKTNGNPPGIPSALDPSASISVHHLNTFLSPLLAVVLERISLASASPSVLFQLRRMLNLMMQAKPDTYSEMLAIVAYHTSAIRKSALSLLSSAWPRAVGHVFDTSPLPTLAPFQPTLRTDGPVHGAQHTQHPYLHQFTPWNFVSAAGSEVFEGFTRATCRVCAQRIIGFGLMCSMCTTASHFDCYDYPDGSFLAQYSITKVSTAQKVAVYRFCDIHAPSTATNDEIAAVRQHIFSPVNLFTLALCFACRRPLWGCTMQAYKCANCMQFIHASCISMSTSDTKACRPTSLDASAITTDWATVRHSFVDEHHDILFSNADMSRKSFEDIAIIHSYLWTQMNIFDNGIAMGSIILTGSPQKFELHHVLELCDAYLAGNTFTVSPTVTEYLEANKQAAKGHLMLYDWSFLTYVTTLLKSPMQSHANREENVSLNYLQVEDALLPRESGDVPQPLSYEVVSVAHMRDVLGYELNVHVDAAARLLLSHLHQLGFMERTSPDLQLLHTNETPLNVHCRFPLPVGLDLSPEVETLFSAVEACLSDIDLTVNEMGFLLLNRRLLPNGMSTEYALRRLARSILVWILGEDDSLAIILRDYVSRALPVPGLRLAANAQPWPVHPSTRVTAGNSLGSGGDYASYRRALLSNYALPWMFALHEADGDTYALLLYDLCCDISRSSPSWIEKPQIFTSTKAEAVALADETLRCIIKIAQASVGFTVFDDILSHWLHAALLSDICDQRLPSMQRAFGKEMDSNSRRSASVLLGAGGTNAITVEPWTLIKREAGEGADGLRHAVAWLNFLARSGVDVPSSVYFHLSSAIEEARLGLFECNQFVEAILHSTYLKSLGRQELQSLLVTQQIRLLPEVANGLKSKQNLDPVSYVRRSLAICLLLYGCERELLFSVRLLDKDVASHSRRNISAKGAPMTKLLQVDSRLVQMLKEYIATENEEISCCAAHFLKLCISDAPLLNDLEGWIGANSEALLRCSWSFYSVQETDILSVRSSLFLRMVVAEPSNIKALLDQELAVTLPWQLRLQTLNKVFRILLDSTSPDFDNYDHQWKAYMFDIFYVYFSSVWVDPREEVRLAVDTWTQALLPSHLEAITGCWSEMLLKATVGERLRMMAFMAQMSVRFNNWQPASWQAIRVLFQDTGFQEFLGVAPSVALGNTDAELHASLILLVLRMLSSASADFSIYRIVKEALARMIGFQDFAPGKFNSVEVVPAFALPCLAELVNLLDSPHPLDLSVSAMYPGRPLQPDDDAGHPVLVGSYLIDIHLALVVELKDLLTLPVSSLKHVLEGLIIIIYKHDLDRKPLVHLQASLRRAIQRALSLLSADTSIEIQQLVLSLCHAYIQRFPSLHLSVLTDFVDAATILLRRYEHVKDDALVLQARHVALLGLTRGAQNGILFSLAKVPREQQFFTVLQDILINDHTTVVVGEPLRDTLLRDTTRRLLDRPYDGAAAQAIVGNLQHYVRIVHHQSHDPDLLRSIGSAMVGIMRRTAEWGDFDINPILEMLCLLVQQNRTHARELLVPMDAILQAALPKLHIDAVHLRRVLQVTSGLSQTGSVGGYDANHYVVSTVLETLFDGLRNTKPIPPGSINSMMEASLDFVMKHTEYSVRFIQSGLAYLQSYRVMERRLRPEFNLSMSVSRCVIGEATKRPEVFSTFMRIADNSGLGLRWWNFLLLQALTSHEDETRELLFAHFMQFTIAYGSVLRPAANVPDPPASDINHAYISIKQWLLLAQGTGPTSRLPYAGVEDTHARTLLVWNELWPPFERLSRAEDAAGRTLPIALMVIATVGDLFLFLRQSRSPLLSELSSKIAWFQGLQASNTQVSTRTKLARALQANASDTIVAPMSQFTVQISTDIVAADKLFAAETSAREPARQA